MQGFDYIIVGGGAAGCVIANRLSADPHVRVALIEAGPSDLQFPANLKTTLPVGNVFLLPHAKYNWQHEFTGGEGVVHRTIPCPRGRLLGGCTSVNGSVYMRGHPGDYDAWRSAGNEGWGFEDVLPMYKRHEKRLFGDAAYHGRDGELDVQKPRAVNPLTQAFVEAAAAAGHRTNEDFNGPEQDGFGIFDVNQRNGTRLSSSRAFLHPAMSRPNLTVMTDCFVERIDLVNGAATGVTVVIEGRRESIVAAQEVILAGGTINSPHLLMHSGIGPAAELEAHSIRVLHPLPGVGRNFQDHACVPLTMMDKGASAYALSWQSLPRLLASPIRYLVDRSGILATNAAEGGGFFRTRPDLDRPDVQITMMPGLKESARAIPREHGVMLLVTLLRPASRGSVSLSSGEPRDRPIIRPGFLDEREDVRTLIAGLREMRRILSMSPIAELLGNERTPGRQRQSDDELEQAIRATLFTVHHPVGTCKMGPATDADAVVDARLRVHGIGRLRVADASVMPTIIAGNTAAPSMMIGERVAAFIQGRQPLERNDVTSPQAALT